MGKFITEQIAGKIPNKTNNDVYCIYTDYEKDHTKSYTTLLACRVSDLSSIPKGMIGKTFDDENYTKFKAKGNVLHGMVFEKWKEIWSADIPRAYKADFELYGDKSKNPENAEVDIFISVKNK